MKSINYYIWSLGLLLFIVSCNDDGYIDPITPVSPGADETAPAITIKSPAQGAVIKDLEVLTPSMLDIEVRDDIELASVTILLDGNQIASFNEFLDYRRFIQTLTEEIGNGTHTWTVRATDTEGKSSEASVEIEKVPFYVPKYQGELLYMSFDQDEFVDLVSLERPNVVTGDDGTGPGFSDESIIGRAYQGAVGGYLTFDGNRFHHDNLSVVFWTKINPSPDRAGVIVMGPPDESNPENPNNRTQGFRLFREGSASNQRYKVNVGTGMSDIWVDGGNADPSIDKWYHVAFTLSPSGTKLYIDGQLAAEASGTTVSWEGCDVLSIMSGAPRFTGWNHLSDASRIDELRIFNRELSDADINDIITDEGGEYLSKFGEIFYMPFDGDFVEQATKITANAVGSPSLTDGGIHGSQCLSGSTESYLSISAANLMNNEFSASFWMKINPVPDRAGILTISAPDADNPTAPNNRTKGFRFFRENAGGNQIFKLNVGTGSGEVWVDGGADAQVDPSADEWHHLVFTMSTSASQCVVYIDGEVAATASLTSLDWSGCTTLSIMSGAPNFVGWNHLSDEGLMDELLIFDKAITESEVSTIYAAGK